MYIQTAISQFDESYKFKTCEAHSWHSALRCQENNTK